MFAVRIRVLVLTSPLFGVQLVNTLYLGLKMVVILFQCDREGSVVPVLPADGVDRLPGVFSGCMEVCQVRQKVWVLACWIPAPDPKLSSLGCVLYALCRTSLTEVLFEVPQIFNRAPVVRAWYRSPDTNFFCLVNFCRW